MSERFQYPVLEASARIGVLDHPGDIHDVAMAVFQALRRCRGNAPSGELGELLDDVLNGMADATDELSTVAKGWNDALEQQQRDGDADLRRRVMEDAA